MHILASALTILSKYHAELIYDIFLSWTSGIHSILFYISSVRAPCVGQQAKTGFFLLYGCFEFSCALVVIWGTMAIAEDFSTSTLWCPSYGSLLMRAHQQQQQQSKNDSRKTIKRKEYCVVAYYIFYIRRYLVEVTQADISGADKRRQEERRFLTDWICVYGRSDAYTNCPMQIMALMGLFVCVCCPPSRSLCFQS